MFDKKTFFWIRFSEAQKAYHANFTSKHFEVAAFDGALGTSFEKSGFLFDWFTWRFDCICFPVWRKQDKLKNFIIYEWQKCCQFYVNQFFKFFHWLFRWKYPQCLAKEKSISKVQNAHRWWLTMQKLSKFNQLKLKSLLFHPSQLKITF